jgi:hypothetical protein
MALACGKMTKVTHILENGRKVKQMVLVFLHRHKVVDTREHLLTLSKAVKELSFFKMGIFTKVNTFKENFMGSDNTTGKTVATTKDISIEEYEADMEYGKRERGFVTNTKDSLKITKKTGMEFIRGGVAIYIRGITKII